MVIQSLIELRKVQKKNRWIGRPTIDELSLNVDIDAGLKTRLEQRILTLFNDCGCYWGGPTFLICFSIMFIPQFLEKGFVWNLLLPPLLIALGAGLLGKYLGLMVSYIRLKIELIRLESMFS